MHSKGSTDPSASAVQVRNAARSDLDAARELLAASGWAHRLPSPEHFASLVARSQRSAVAVDAGRVVGFARGITDGLSNGYLSMLVVAPSHRRRGVGRALVKHIMAGDASVSWILRAGREDAAPFFARLGFVPSDIAMERPRAALPHARQPASAASTRSSAGSDESRTALEPLQIRLATPDDIDITAALFDAYRQFYEQGADLPLATAFIGERLRRKDSEILLAAPHGQPALGFCQLYPLFSSIQARPIYQLSDLFVVSAARRSGIGRALLLAAEQLAARKGRAALELTTARTNTAAQAAYEALGWVRDEVFIAYARQLDRAC